MIENEPMRWQAPLGASQIEAKPDFRADVDQSGDWYVWRRLGANGWATMRRCECRESAHREAAVLNGQNQSSN